MALPARSSREIAHQAVRSAIVEAAEQLFRERGYRDTTVGAIARAVGISERTFFRYFATKDDLLFSSFAADTQWVIDSIDAQPVTLSPWDTLKTVVEAALDRLDEDAQRTSGLFQKIAADSPHVSAAYIGHLQAFQRRVAEALWLRWQNNLAGGGGNGVTQSSPEDRDERIVLSAMVSSVFAAINEVTALSTDRSAAEQKRLIAATLSAMHPSSAAPGWGGVIMPEHSHSAGEAS